MTCNDLIDRAWEAFDAEKYDEAEAYGRRALMFEPDSIEARVAVARALINKEEYQQALPILREAVSIASEDSEIRTILGIALFENCEFQEALGNLRLAIELGADSPDSLYWLGLSLERQGDYTRAEESFARAHQSDPEHYPLPMRLSRLECVRAVEEARARLPPECDPCLENVAIRVEDLPDEAILKGFNPPMDPCLLGLFVGTPLGEKSLTDISPGLPEMIFIFQRNLERSCQDRQTLVDEICKTLYHEIGHYMGRDEDELAEMGLG